VTSRDVAARLANELVNGCFNNHMPLQSGKLHVADVSVTLHNSSPVPELRQFKYWVTKNFLTHPPMLADIHRRTMLYCARNTRIILRFLSTMFRQLNLFPSSGW
jgi:hypothetical protein